MMQLFQHITGIVDPEKICNMDFNMPVEMPFHFHCKDLQGKYIGCNDKVVHDVGFNNKADLLGRTDFEFDCLGENEARNFTAIDKFVAATNQTHFFTQSVTLADKQKYIAMNHKTPLRTRANKIIGVISFGVL